MKWLLLGLFLLLLGVIQFIPGSPDPGGADPGGEPAGEQSESAAGLH